ncbi:MAG: alanine--tRNA ligase-related protein, partial [Actinomycetota bacterium]
TAELAEEQGLEVDTAAFERLMAEQRERARAAVKGGRDERALVEVAREAGRTDFLGYEQLRAEGRITGLVRAGRRVEAASEGDEAEVVLDRTPFYAEGGGQVGDTGVLRSSTGELRVEDSVPGPGESIVHRGRVTRGEVRAGQEVEAEVDADRRAATARSHTGTHVLHWTLRHLLGEHARQAGSLVAPGRLRFDFTHFEGLGRDDVERIEAAVNGRLGEDAPVRAYETTFEFARSQGALALFGERYGELVRVVEVGDYSIELCGGTHVPHTGVVQLALVQSEQSIGSGLRRIEALVGPDALEHVHLERRLLEEVTEALGAGDPRQAPDRARRAAARIKELEQRLGTLQAVERDNWAKELVAGAERVDGVLLVIREGWGGEGSEGLRQRAEFVRRYMESEGPGAVVIGLDDRGKVTLVAACTSALIERGVTAPRLLEPIAAQVGGRSGGKPHLAFGGGTNAGALRGALALVPARLRELLSNGG